MYRNSNETIVIGIDNSTKIHVALPFTITSPMNPDQYRQVFGTLRRIDVQEQAVLITCEVVAMLSVMLILGPYVG